MPETFLAWFPVFVKLRDWSKSVRGGGGVGRSREGVGHGVLSLV